MPRASPSASISACLKSSFQRRAATASLRLELAHVEGRNAARRRAHDDLDARQHRFRQMHVEFGAGAVERLDEDRLPLLAQLGRVVLARRVDEAGKEALERIAPHEQAEALALAEMQDSHRRAQQLVLGDLEQLVARIVLEDVDQRLAGVTARRQPCARDDVGDLAPQQRNVRRLCAVRGRREQAEEAILAADFSLRVEALDRDVVEIAGPVHGRARRRLGHDEQLGTTRIGASLPVAAPRSSSRLPCSRPRAGCPGSSRARFSTRRSSF